MWGMIVKITLLPGKRDEMVEILHESAADMPGCLSYVVAKDVGDENTIWVTEVWDSMASHDASLSLPAVSERDSSRQSTRFKFRENRCHKPGVVSGPTSR